MKSSDITIYRAALILLLLAFGILNGFIYSDNRLYKELPLSANALKGQKIWQENNCFSCHQLYGLGGYLGPDLTNIHSIKGKEYVKAMLNSGIGAMPKFNFSEQEKEWIAAYLEAVDRTGFYPNKDAVFSPEGWVEIKTK